MAYVRKGFGGKSVVEYADEAEEAGENTFLSPPEQENTLRKKFEIRGRHPLQSEEVEEEDED